MKIPADPRWCSHCVKPDFYGRGPGEPCLHHRGPDDKPVLYSGEEVYTPSEWVLEVVGNTYVGMFGTFLCFGYDPRHGFWMRDVSSGEERNISERAIGRTYHHVREVPKRNVADGQGREESGVGDEERVPQDLARG